MKNVCIRFVKKILFFGLIFCSLKNGYAQTPQKKTRILFLLDASSSMTYNWNSSVTRFGVASNILLRIIDSMYAVNNEVEFAVRAYGTQYPAQEKNCFDSKLEVPFNYQNVAQIKTRLQFIKPYGYSPIAYSLQQASDNELNNTSAYDYSIIFITDGGESCNGDICKTFNDFLKKKITVKPYIIGLDKNEKLSNYYECLGNFIEVNTPSDIDKAVKMIVDANRSIIEKPKQLKLNTTYSNTEILKDTVIKIVQKETPTEPIIIKNTASLSLLKLLLYPNFKKEIALLIGKKIALKVGSAKLRFQFEENAIAQPVITKQTDVFPLLKAKTLTVTKFNSKVVGKKLPKQINSKATLRFNWDEPIVKETNVFPELKMTTIVFKNTYKSNFKGKKIASFAKQKATLRFNWDEPLVRETAVFPILKIKNTSFVKKTKVALNAKIYKPKINKATLRFEIDEPKKEVLTFIKAAKYPNRYSYAYRLPNDKKMFPKGKATLRFVVAEKPKPVVAKKDTVKPVASSGEMKYTIETLASDETKIQIYLVGPDGKFYSKTKPIVEFMDAKTKQLVTKINRNVINGVPEIIPFTAGTYDIFIKEFNVARVYNFPIKEKMLNKITLVLEEGTLHFVYGTNLKRPVEYTAVVNRRFAVGSTIQQKCTQLLHYEPGTYYVEINTLPVIKRSVEIEFFKEYLLPIDEPGTLQITNINKIGKIELQCVLGDQFVTFYSTSILGDLSKQKLVLQPGVYKAVFPKDPKVPMAGSKIVDFKINSNQTSNLELE